MAEGARILLLGATGTIGRATAAALCAQGHEVTALVRPASQVEGLTEAVMLQRGALGDPGALAGGQYDVLVSCMASRSGQPRDAWAVDHDAHVMALDAARAAGVGHMVLVSALCVQKPCLAFQQAKLAFEAHLRASGLRYSIIRPTAFFKSLSGQIARVQAGRPYLLFGDGQLTACKPISDRDLANYVARSIEDRDLWNRVLPIGGPGPAITPLAQGEWLFDRLDLAPRYRRVPVALMDAIIAGLSIGGRVSDGLRAKAELARIGRYYATESMLVLDPETGRYEAGSTPETGSDRLFDHYDAVIEGRARVDLGAHAVF